MLEVDVGGWLRGLRERHRLTQAQLAYRAGTSQQAISAIEAGRTSPSAGLLDRLAAACGERLVISSVPREVPFDPEQLAAELADQVELRAERALSWNRFAGELVVAGARLRGEL